MRSCIENLFHLSHKKENIEDLAYQFSSDDLLDEEDLPPLPFPEFRPNVLDGSRVTDPSEHGGQGGGASAPPKFSFNVLFFDEPFKCALSERSNKKCT